VAPHRHVPRAPSPTPAPAVAYLRMALPSDGEIAVPSSLSTKASQISRHLPAEGVDPLATVARINRLAAALPNPSARVEMQARYIHLAAHAARSGADTLAALERIAENEALAVLPVAVGGAE
jgi:hypothetical protein